MFLIFTIIIASYLNFTQKENVPRGNIQSIVEYRMDADSILTETITREYLRDGKTVFYQNEKPKEETHFIKSEYTALGYLSTQETNEHKAFYEYINDSILVETSYYQSHKLISSEAVKVDLEANSKIAVLRDFDGTLIKWTTTFYDDKNELIRKEVVLLTQSKTVEKTIYLYKNGLEQKRIYEFYDTVQNREIEFFYNKKNRLIKQTVKGKTPTKIRKKYNVQGDLIKVKRYEKIEGSWSLMSEINHIYEYDYNNHWIKMTETKNRRIIGNRTRTITYYPE